MGLQTKKARTGLKNLYFAVMTEDAETALSYETPFHVPGLISLEVNPNVNSATLYTDNKASIFYSTIGSVEVTIGKDNLPDDLLSVLLGRDKVGAVNYVTNVYSAPYVAMMYEQTYDNGTSSFVKLYKGKFSEPSQSNETKGDSVNFQTGEIVGTFLATDYLKTFGDDTRSIIMSCVDEESVGYADEGSTWFDYVIEAAPAFVVTPNISDGDTGVATSTVVTLSSTTRFNEEYSLNEDSFYVVQDGESAKIAGTYSISVDKQSITFTPASALASASAHTITYKVKDVYGQEIDTTLINFTTA